MIVLGFDVSLRSTGWAALDYDTGQLAGSGLIQTPTGERLLPSLSLIQRETRKVLNSYTDLGADVAIERGFVGNSGTTTRHLAMAWAVVALEASNILGVEAAEIAVGTIKKVATGNGKSLKGEVTQAATDKWGEECNQNDIADAAWCAEAHRQELIKYFSKYEEQKDSECQTQMLPWLHSSERSKND